MSLLAYTRLAHEGGFHLDGYAAVRRWIGETEKSLGLPPAAECIGLSSWPPRSPSAARAARCCAIIKMLADDALGGTRERIEDPLPASYFAAFDASPAIPISRARGRREARAGCRLPSSGILPG